MVAGRRYRTSEELQCCVNDCSQLEMSAATKTKARWFRIYSADRKVRKAVGANTLEELIDEGIHRKTRCQ